MTANHGSIAKYYHEFEGSNSRLDALQPAIRKVKLQHLPEWTEKRIAVAGYYLANLKDIQQITHPVRQDWAKQVYHLFVIRTEKHNELAKILADKGIQTCVYTPFLYQNSKPTTTPIKPVKTCLPIKTIPCYSSYQLANT